MQQISAALLKKKLTEDADLFLLDVREEFEHADFNIGGTLMPLGEIIKRIAEIPRDKPVIVYCRKGIRSQIAIMRLQERHGFTNLVNLQGGVEKWNL